MQGSNEYAAPAGIVPGFPEALPRSLENAWLVLAQYPKLVSIALPPEGGVRITLKKNPKSIWVLAISCTVFGVVGLIGIAFFDRYQRSDRFDLPIHFSVIKLYLLAAMCTGAGILMALINLASGGVDRDAVIHAAPGRLHIDRWVSGDHIVREYSREDINQIWTDGAIEIGFRLGPFSLATFGRLDVQDAAAEIIGRLFWGDDAVVGRNVRSQLAAHGRMRILVHGAQRPD